MKRKIGTAILVSALAQLALADSTVQQAQEELKEQGFYFGQIDGDKNTDTIAAIRRFQIRSGLEVTGELDQETLRALHAAATAATPTPPPQNLEGSANTTERAAPGTSPQRDLESDREQPAAVPSGANVSRDIPYELTPAEAEEPV